MTEWIGWEKDDWTKYEDRTIRWENIRMEAVEWSRFDKSDVEALKSLIEIRELRGEDIERVSRISPTEVEVVWYDDVQSDSDGHRRVSNIILRRLCDLLHQYFGPNWRVRWKEDGRRSDRHPQRAIIRRASHQNFSYVNESEADYLRHLKGQPDGTPEEISKYGEMDRYRVDSLLSGAGGADFYVYESDTGTKHIIPELRDRLVFEDVKCACGLNINNSELIDGTRVAHYGEVLSKLVENAEHKGLGGWSRPTNLEGLCERCWRSYSTTRGTGSRTPPMGKWKQVVQWAAGDSQ